MRLTENITLLRWSRERREIQNYLWRQNNGTKEARKVGVEVIVCFSARSALQRFLFETLCAQEKRRAAAMSPAMCFEWIYMTSHRVPTSLFAVCMYTRMRARTGQHVGRDSLQRQMLDHLPVAPLEIRNSVWLYPICPPKAGTYRLAGFFIRLNSTRSSPDDTTQRIVVA